MADKRSSWKQLSSRVVYETSWITLVEDEVITPTRKPGKYTYVKAHPFIIVVARDEMGRFLLINQYRYPTGERFWEFPAGAVDEGESLEEAFHREFGEETGLKASKWQILGEIYECVSAGNEPGTVILAEDLTEAPELRKPDEGILMQQWFSLEELDNVACAGELRDAKTGAALNLVRAHFR